MDYPDHIMGTTDAEIYAQLLGHDISAAGIRQACRRGKLLASKLGRNWIIEEGDLDAWLEDPRAHKRGPRRDGTI